MLDTTNLIVFVAGVLFAMFALPVIMGMLHSKGKGA